MDALLNFECNTESGSIESLSITLGCYSCSWLQEESIPLWRHIYLSVTFLTLSSWIGHAEVIFTEKVGVFARKIEAKDRETFAL